MTNFLTYFGVFLTGFIFCLVLAKFYFGQKAEKEIMAAKMATESELVINRERLLSKEENVSRLESTLKVKDEQLSQFQKESTLLKTRVAEIEVRLEDERALLVEKTKLLSQSEEKLTNTFKALSSEALKSNNQAFLDLAKASLSQFQETAKGDLDKRKQAIEELVNPLRERLTDFQKKIEQTYTDEIKERVTLKAEIGKIYDLNQQMSLDAQNLTRALRGDVKAQGNWGEMVLEHILEKAGLREGEEYIVQGKDMGLRDEAGNVFRPDVIVKLPEGKHLIVDSKVSLTHYQNYIEAENDEKRDLSLKQYVDSLYSHVTGLGNKFYHQLQGLDTPEIVLMFVPVEGAYSLAMQKDHAFFAYAWEKSVVVVGPSTLLATLRAIETVWKRDRQNKNALEIARQGGALYDKMVGFVESLQEVGKNINRANDSYTEALSRLSQGKGNILSRVEQLKNLGAKASKKLPEELLNNEDESLLLTDQVTLVKESPLLKSI